MKPKSVFPLCLAVCLAVAISASAAPQVTLLRTPNRGIQPQAVLSADGTVHLIYFGGTPEGGDTFYTKAPANSENFPPAIRVNTRPNSVMATGTIRGAQVALGKNGRVHVAWN